MVYTTIRSYFITKITRIISRQVQPKPGLIGNVLTGRRLMVAPRKRGNLANMQPSFSGRPVVVMFTVRLHRLHLCAAIVVQAVFVETMCWPSIQCICLARIFAKLFRLPWILTPGACHVIFGPPIYSFPPGMNISDTA